MRLDLLNTFYEAIERFRIIQNGYKHLANPIPNQFKAPGVYFFFDEGIARTNSNQLRVIRVGKTGKSNRLTSHRGNIGNGGGNHRSSVFREHVGGSIIQRDELEVFYPNWNAVTKIDNELHLEQLVSEYIGPLPYIFKPVKDSYTRKLIEERSIELISNCNQQIQIDIPPADWLGFHCPNKKIVSSHLWNDHFTNNYDPNDEDRYIELIDALQE